MNDIITGSSKIGIISDIHIGVRQHSAKWHNVTYKWAEWCIKEFKKRKIDTIICCGDLFHHRDEISVNSINFTSKFLNLFTDFNVVLIVGNHDCYLRDSSTINSVSILKGWSNINVIEQTTTFKYKDRVVTMLPWCGNVDDIEKSDVLFGHLEVESFKMTNHHVCEKGVSVKSLLDKTDLLISGHFHIREEREFDNGKIIYVGNPFQMDFGDAGNQKGLYVLDLEDLSYEFVQNTISPTFSRLKLSTLLKRIKDKQDFSEDLNGNVVKLVVDTEIKPETLDKLLIKFNQKNPFDITVDYDVNFTKLNVEDTGVDMSEFDIPEAIKEFIKIAEISDKERVTDYVIDLYNKYR